VWAGVSSDGAASNARDFVGVVSIDRNNQYGKVSILKGRTLLSAAAGSAYFRLLLALPTGSLSINALISQVPFPTMERLIIEEQRGQLSPCLHSSNFFASWLFLSLQRPPLPSVLLCPIFKTGCRQGTKAHHIAVLPGFLL
jgi:hypothetical protein